MMTVNEARELAKNGLSADRFHHTECVAVAAKVLAERYGGDENKATIAAYLHDILKERPAADLLQMARGSDIIDGETAALSPPLLHAFAGGIYVERELCQPADVAAAVTYHTTGRNGMTLLDKIVYLADYISDDRDFGGVDEVRELAESSLDAACLKATQNGLIHLIKKGRYVDAHSIEAYNYFVILLKGNEDVR